MVESIVLNEIKINNIKQILLNLLFHGCATKLTLSSCTGLSNTTLSDCINNLEKLNIVRVIGVEESIGGRRPNVYSVNPDYGGFLGIIADSSGVRYGVTDFSGKLIKQYPPLTAAGQPVITLIYQAIEVVLAEFADKNIAGIGISINGSMEAQKGIVIKNDLLNWNNVHIKELIERKYFISTYLIHKADAGVTYEKITRKTCDVENLVCAYPVETDKLGVILNGGLLCGHHNSFGHLEKFPSSEAEFSSMCRFLGAEHILIGYPEGKADFLPKNKAVTVIKSGDSYFTQAAAVTAQSRWFESIYFML